ncbi:MAG: hypothetical protein WAU64_00225 [Methanoregula sp.]|uniref:hypothetical protein n=1 Tax=Methanoregula sp. TaxID=2052170 RepID=UPI003BB1EA20
MGKTYPYGKGDGTAAGVSPEWLEKHLHAKGLIVIDCQPNVHEYIQNHIPRGIVRSREPVPHSRRSNTDTLASG